MFKLRNLNGIFEGTYYVEIIGADVITCKTGQEAVRIEVKTKENYRRCFYILTDCGLMYKLVNIVYEKYNTGELLNEKDFIGVKIGIETHYTNNSNYSSITDIFPIEDPPTPPEEVGKIE